MKLKLFLLAIGIVCANSSPWLLAQTNLVVTTNSIPDRTNSAVLPAPHEVERTQIVLQVARDNPGACDVVFIGDSLVQRWEGNGRSVWEKYYGQRKALNLGVDGDRTQHVLWRFEQGQLNGLKPKVAVVMIGSNNCNRDEYTEGEVLAGVTAIVWEVRRRLPETKILLLGILPRSQTFSAARAKMLQVNLPLSRLQDGKMIHYLDIGPLFVEADGSISKSVMPDFSHLSERGYELWAAAIEPKLKALLEEK